MTDKSASTAFPLPSEDIAPNTYAFEQRPLVKATGFREYDARWWVGIPGHEKPPELNLMGVQAVGLGLATLAHQRRLRPDIVVGHDYRSYSSAIKMALMSGLMAGGMRVHDIGLAVTPMAYFAQFALNAECVAMVTASHNDNGWTGVKMGLERPVTLGPDDMLALKKIVLEGKFDSRGGGHYVFHGDIAERYMRDLTDRPKLRRKLKVVAACGNGTAGAFAPQVLEAVGCDVIPLDATPDHTFPRYNPNPEDLKMLKAMADAVREHGADLALGFDGDGDRCGVVDNEGKEIFSDKIGVLLARDLSSRNKNAQFVVDVKSTALYETDPVLIANGARADYFKTGHSYIKRRVKDLGALAGFEKSGHFFYGPPIGRGYDDGLVTALNILDMLDRNPDSSLADLYRSLPHTWGSPTMSAHCADEVKYDVVRRVTSKLEAMAAKREHFGGQPIDHLITVNGVRIVTGDGTWGLVRASSNKPELVVVIESPKSEARLREMFQAVDTLLRKNPEVGDYNQTI